MNKKKLVLSTVLAMALAIPVGANAAADLTVTGDTTIRTAYGQHDDDNYEIMGSWRTRANLDMRVNKGDNISAYARYRLRSNGFQDFGGTGDLQNPLEGNVLEAYVDYKGPWFAGSPSVTTRIGRFESRSAAGSVHDWVADVTRRDGIRVSGIQLGGAEFGLYHGWNGDSEDTFAFIDGSFSVDMVELNGVFTTTNDRATSTRHNDWAVNAVVTPSEGIEIGADYARDGEHDANAWKLTGEIATGSNLTFNASVWNTGDAFYPERRRAAHTERLDFSRTSDGTGANGRGRAWGDPWIARGFSVGVETNQAGLPIEVSYKSGTIFDATNLRPQSAPFASRNMSVIGFGTTIVGIGADLAYTTIEDVDPITDLILTKKVTGLPIAGDVNLKGVVRMQSGSDARFGGDATWSAPNGLTLGLHYANYDRMRDWNHDFDNDDISEGIDIGPAGEADGFAVTAGYQLNW